MHGIKSNTEKASEQYHIECDIKRQQLNSTYRNHSNCECDDFFFLLLWHRKHKFSRVIAHNMFTLLLILSQLSCMLAVVPSFSSASKDCQLFRIFPTFASASCLKACDQLKKASLWFLIKQKEQRNSSRKWRSGRKSKEKHSEGTRLGFKCK